MIVVYFFVILLLLSGIFKGLNDAKGYPQGWKHLRDWIPGLLIGAAIGGFGASVASYMGWVNNSHDTSANGWIILMIATFVLQLGSSIIGGKIFAR